MRDNPELDSSLAIDYIQNRRHFTVIQVFILSPFSFFLLNHENVCLAPCLSFRCILRYIFLPDNALS